MRSVTTATNGDRASVLSSHRTLEAARKAVRRMGSGYVIREGGKRAGDAWLRTWESMYPVVKPCV